MSIVRIFVCAVSNYIYIYIYMSNIVSAYFLFVSAMSYLTNVICVLRSLPFSPQRFYAEFASQLTCPTS
jgi:hypothetical protein